jgi:hypothetical protein
MYEGLYEINLIWNTPLLLVDSATKYGLFERRFQLSWAASCLEEEVLSVPRIQGDL